MEERRTSPSLTPPPEYIPQPDHFYTSGGEPRLNPLRNLRPDDDPMAARGIPVFKPSWFEFCNFEKYMEAIQPWGMKSGIVKVIPPKEWKHELPDVKPMLEDIRIRHPIEQNMVGISGLFRQQNIEKRRVYSLREWFELGMSEDFRTPGMDEVRRDLKKGVAGTGKKSRVKKEVAEVSEASASPAPFTSNPDNGQQAMLHEAEAEINTDLSMDLSLRDNSLDASIANSPHNDSVPLDPPEGETVYRSQHQRLPNTKGFHGLVGPPGYPADDTEAADRSTTYGTQIVTNALPSAQTEAQGAIPDAAAAQKAALARQKKAARAALKTDLDANFLSEFDPAKSWLPPGCTEGDYRSPEFVSGLERLYWRSCGVGKAPMYGADLPGSLFSHNTGSSLVSNAISSVKKSKGVEGPIPWDVSNLPSALTRLLPRGMKIPGVNTPYLYFGMWRATFAWHVEDMDLFSINYIHWGAPKHWYAVPQARANALEGVMKQFFPSDKNGCPQFLRHKSYLASPTALRSASVKPNTLVQQAGEFVITYPRGYHAGFNTGLNCAESVNFALDSWLDLGRKARFCHCVSDSVRIDVDALLAEKARIEAEERAGIRRPQVEPRQATIRPALPPQAYVAPATVQRPRKRKLQELHPPSSPSHYQPDLDPVTPAYQIGAKKFSELPPAKRFHREIDVRVLPCCLCASPEVVGLLPVNDPPFPHMGIPVPRNREGALAWKAHEICAMTIPETWVDEIDGQKRVFGVDAIVRDRWNLRCYACSTHDHKAHGAPIQCAKGKCSKALHVTCAEQGKANSTFRIVNVTESEVLITLDAAAALPMASSSESHGEIDPASLVAANGTAVDGSTHRVLKTIQKFSVEVLCGLHNPAAVQAKRNAKAQKLHQVLLAIPVGERIRVKFSTGVYECTLLQVNPADETVQVAWSEGGTKVFNWNKIIFGGWKADPAQRNAFSDVVAAGPSNPDKASASFISPYILPAAPKPKILNDIKMPPQTGSFISATYAHPPRAMPAAIQPIPRLGDHSSSFLPSDPYRRQHLYQTYQKSFESPVDIPLQPGDMKGSQASVSEIPLSQETMLALPAIPPDSPNADISMKGL